MRPQLVAQGEDDQEITLPKVGQSDLLRFITCGSVDDGKSTLIGRILYDAGAVFEDQLEALDRDSRKFGTVNGERDFALLVDGLSAEREQGITIDVAYRYFATPKRSFIVADTPGHEQYTRNMATGASTADCAIILIDARLGVLPQTRRHSFIVSLMGVRHVLVAVNKMDLVDFDERVFSDIAKHYRKVVASLGFASIDIIPVSARDGDNISTLSDRTPWYQGQALLPWLETIDVTPAIHRAGAGIFPVQYVNRPDHRFRGFAGTIASGELQQGEAVISLPSKRVSSIARIVTADGDLACASAGQAVTLVLGDEIDTSRGDVLVSASTVQNLRVTQSIKARVLVTGDGSLKVGQAYEVKLGTATAQAVISAIHYAVDIEQFSFQKAEALPMNGIGLVSLRLDRPLALASYAEQPVLGGFILIDRLSRQTSAFGFVESDVSVGDDEHATRNSWRVRLGTLIGTQGSALRHQRQQQVLSLIVEALMRALLLAILGAPVSFTAVAVVLDALFRPLLKITLKRLWAQRMAKPVIPVDRDFGEGI
jgi:bifunctional enzyme CysN/CysC